MPPACEYAPPKTLKGAPVPKYEAVSPARDLEHSTCHLSQILRVESKSYLPVENYVAHLSEKFFDFWQVRFDFAHWYYDIAEDFQYEGEIIIIALSYFDRYMALTTKEDQYTPMENELQVLALTCLFVAIKTFCDATDETECLASIAAIGRFQMEEIEKAELSILNMLEWRINVPSTFRFIETFVRLFPEWNDQSTKFASRELVRGSIYNSSCIFATVLAMDGTLVFNYRSSELAFASIVCAMYALERHIRMRSDAKFYFLELLRELTGWTPTSDFVGDVYDTLVTLLPSMVGGECKLDPFLIQPMPDDYFHDDYDFNAIIYRAEDIRTVDTTVPKLLMLDSEGEQKNEPSTDVEAGEIWYETIHRTNSRSRKNTQLSRLWSALFRRKIRSRLPQ